MMWTRILDIFRPRHQVAAKRRSEGYDMFGLPQESRRHKISRNTVKMELADCTYQSLPNRLNLRDVKAAIGMFSKRPDLFEDRLDIIRTALSYEGDMADLMSDFELSDRHLRQFLMSVEARLISLTTGEPLRRLTWELERHFFASDF